MTIIEITIAPDITLCHHFQCTRGAWQTDDNASESETSLEITLTIPGNPPGSIYRYSLTDNSCRVTGGEVLLPGGFAC